VNKRPNKNVLMELCMKEWSWSKEEFEQSHEEISIEKIKIIDLTTPTGVVYSKRRRK